MINQDPNQFNYYWVVLVMLKDVILGFVGGLVAYLFDYSRAKKNGNESFVFKVSALVVNMVLGAFVGFVVGTVVPIDTTGRDGIIALSGVASFNILLLTESRLALWIFDKFVGKVDSKDK